jgi:hypothetical protein
MAIDQYRDNMLQGLARACQNILVQQSLSGEKREYAWGSLIPVKLPPYCIYKYFQLKAR